jgi:hypothetical protein
MITPPKAVIAGAAIAGLLAGSMAVRTYAASTSLKAGTALRTLADDEKGNILAKATKSARGRGQGGCKTSDNGCKGKNSCKGKGGCATDGSKPQLS